MKNGDVLVGAVYHPPRPTYKSSEFLDFLEKSMDAVSVEFPTSLVILAGGFNVLSNT